MDEITKELEKCYIVIQRTVKHWEEVQRRSNDVIKSLLNLSDQLQCCHEGHYELELKNEFPDLKQRMLFKITKVLEKEMKKLRETLETFRGLMNDLEKARNLTFQVYTKYSETVDFEKLTTGTPTCPPYALMLEWVMDITRWYKNLYEQKKDLLDNIVYNDTVYLQSLARKWKDDSSLYRVKGILEQVSMFCSHQA